VISGNHAEKTCAVGMDIKIDATHCLQLIVKRNLENHGAAKQ